MGGSDTGADLIYNEIAFKDRDLLPALTCDFVLNIDTPPSPKYSSEWLHSLTYVLRTALQVEARSPPSTTCCIPGTVGLRGWAKRGEAAGAAIATLHATRVYFGVHHSSPPRRSC